MKSIYATLVALILVANLQADVVVFEDFEDATITYTTSVADDLSDIAARDYFGRISPGTATPPGDVAYSNLQGTGYYGVQDSDGTPSGNVDVVTLDWAGIDISSYENLQLSWMVAEDSSNDGNEDWDTSSSLRILFQLDAGGFQNLFAIESEFGGDGNQTNEAPRVDTDFDGTGDGTAITDVFALFSEGIADGSILDIRIIIEDLDSGDEDIAFDNFLLEGDLSSIPEPSTCIFITLSLGMILSRRRR